MNKSWALACAMFCGLTAFSGYVTAGGASLDVASVVGIAFSGAAAGMSFASALLFPLIDRAHAAADHALGLVDEALALPAHWEGGR